jgi:hypothetical protein
VPAELHFARARHFAAAAPDTDRRRREDQHADAGAASAGESQRQRQRRASCTSICPARSDRAACRARAEQPPAAAAAL